MQRHVERRLSRPVCSNLPVCGVSVSTALFPELFVYALVHESGRILEKMLAQHRQVLFGTSSLRPGLHRTEITGKPKTWPYRFSAEATACVSALLTGLKKVVSMLTAPLENVRFQVPTI